MILRHSLPRSFSHSILCDEIFLSQYVSLPLCFSLYQNHSENNSLILCSLRNENNKKKKRIFFSLELCCKVFVTKFMALLAEQWHI